MHQRVLMPGQVLSTPPEFPPWSPRGRLGRNDVLQLHDPVVELVHLVPDSRGAVLERELAERVEGPQPAAADFQVAAGFVLVRVPRLPGEHGLLSFLIPGL